MAQHRRALASVLLGLQGGLILLGAVLVGMTGTAWFPFDSLVGTDASVAALVMGAAFVLAIRTPTQTWINLAILYDVLTIVVQGVKYGTGYGVTQWVSAIAISAIFLILFLVAYPYREKVGAAHPA